MANNDFLKSLKDFIKISIFWKIYSNVKSKVYFEDFFTNELEVDFLSHLVIF